MEERKKTGIGVVGCGLRLRYLVRELLASSSRIEVTGVFDPSAQAREAALVDFGGRARVYDSVEALTEDEEVDWVFVGSPNCYHAEHAIAAFAAGKDVFCEKPLATHLDDCLAIRAAVEASDRQFFFGFCLRYSPFYRKIHELLGEGKAGEVLSFEFNETVNFNHGGYIMGNWRRFREMAGTHLLEKCCHDVDLANWFTGSLPVRVASFGGLGFYRPENQGHIARLGRNRDGKEAYRVWQDFDGTDPFCSEKTIVDNQVAIIEYASGCRGTFHTNCNAGIPERRFYLLGSEGAIRADAMTGRVEYRPIGFDAPSTTFDCTAEGGHHGGDALLVRELKECILEGRRPTVGIAEGMEAALSCLGIDAAMDSGTVFDLLPLWDEAGVMPLGDQGHRRISLFDGTP